MDTREKILQAAREIFVEKGKDGARMQEIADRAGVNKALLHYYFTSKEKLYLEIIYDAFSELFRYLSERFNEPHSIEEFVEILVENHVNFVAKNRDLLKLLGFAVLREEEAIYKPLIKSIKNEFKIPKTVFSIFTKAMLQGKIRKINPVQTVISIISMNIFYFFISPLLKQIAPIPIKNEEKFIEERKKAIVDLVLRGILK